MKKGPLYKSRFVIRLFFLLFGIVLLAGWGYFLARGYPWGIDDGVKRLAARSFISSGDADCLISTSFASPLDDRFFPLPFPFVESTTAGYRPIFPVLWSVFGGIGYRFCGGFGFYLLTATAFIVLLWILYHHLAGSFSPKSAFWGVLIASATLIFYGITFWEHAFALLLLLPLFIAIDRSAGERYWLFAGVCFGLAVYLRPETALLFPLLWVLPGLKTGVRWRRVALFSVGMAVLIAVSGVLERTLADRWLPVQAFYNLQLNFSGYGFYERVRDVFLFFCNAPISPLLFAAIVMILGFVSLLFKRPGWWVIGIPLLALTALGWGLYERSAFGITAYSQGLLFALPWIALTVLPSTHSKRLRDPFFILGEGYLLLAYLFGPVHPGMHWGPRFLFPALFPLLFRALSVLQDQTARRSRWIMLITGLTAVVFAAAGITAIAERGAACARVAAIVRDSEARYLILSQWHEGADLEPLWGQLDLFWVQGRGDAEELTIRFEDEHIRDGIAWLMSDGKMDINDLPWRTVSGRDLPDNAGWKGKLWKIALADSQDVRWGQVYWHAARRRVAAGMMSAAAQLFRRAVKRLPDNADLRYDYAVCLGQMGLTSRALEQLRETLRLNPHHAAAGELRRRLRLP